MSLKPHRLSRSRRDRPRGSRHLPQTQSDHGEYAKVGGAVLDAAGAPAAPTGAGENAPALLLGVPPHFCILSADERLDQHAERLTALELQLGGTHSKPGQNAVSTDPIYLSLRLARP